jgi:hypothetical protein
MKIYPWDDILSNANHWIGKGAEVYQQFNCEHCGAKQTIDEPNVFHVTGSCEECKKITDIKKNGMNLMVTGSGKILL